MMKLTIEMVPKNTWFDNVRSNVSKEQWKALKERTAMLANHQCEICSQRGPRWPVECHEVWSYNNGVQKLERLIALCPDCHEVKHFGLASMRGRQDKALAHLMKVNKISLDDAVAYVESVVEQWKELSNKEWELDISLIYKKDPLMEFLCV